MHPVLFFDPILIQTPRSKIYRRLGYRKGVTRMLPRQKEETERYIEEALSLIRLTGAGLPVSILKKGASEIILEGDIRIDSHQLAVFLRNCSEMIIMGATAGSDIVNAIQEDTSGGDITRGVVFDATASEMADAALDWIMDYFNRSLRRENKKLLQKRFSAGYGDLLLENQTTLYKLLQLDRLGVRITESCILIPEKSVTAITGIELLSTG
ncbi:MAG: methionine synthase [Deltaproteobacteria bacterium]